MADLSDKFASEPVRLIGSDSTGLETNFVNADANGSLKTLTVDSTGTAIDSLNSGAGLNAMNIALTGTNYVLSTVNSTTVQLAAGATFTGTIETVFNQQAASMLLTSDQNGTLILNQYIDAAGTRALTPLTFSIVKNVPFIRSITINGNFFNLSFKNTGPATTTTLNINTAYGTIPATTSLGNGQVSIDEINGIPATARPDGFLRTQIDPQTLFFDTFETLNTTDNFTVAGTVPPTVNSGNLVVAPGTAANATSYANTKPAFTPGSSAFLQYSTLVQLEVAVITGNQRFWGIGVLTTPTLAVPVTNGSIFEIDNVTGNLFASVYSNSVRTQTSLLVRPIDGTTHRYAIYYKGSRVYFEIDNVQVATFTYPNPQVGSLNLVVGSVNGGTLLATAPTLNASLIGVGDTGRNATQISDGTSPWRKAKVTAAGALSMDNTNSSFLTNFTVAGTAQVFDSQGRDTIIVYVSGTFVGTLLFEGNYGDNVNWIAMQAVQLNGGVIPYAQIAQGTAGVGLFNLINTGFTSIRLRASVLTSGTMVVYTTLSNSINNIVTFQGVPFVDKKDFGRNNTNYFTVGQVLSTGTDTLVSLTGYKSGAAVAATTTPAVVTTGKTFRITGITITYIAIATAGSIRFTLRANTGGVVAITSPVVLNYIAIAPAATAGVGMSYSIPIPEGLEFAAGTGIGVSMVGLNALGVAAAEGYGQITIQGYEY